MFNIFGVCKLNFVESHPSLPEGGVYDDLKHWSVDDDMASHPDLKPGCYSETPATKSINVSASNPYHSYWLAQLSRFAQQVSPRTVQGTVEEFLGKPFVELIDLSSNAIGPSLCGKLARDFAENEKAAQKFAEEQLVRNTYFPYGDNTRKELMDLFEFAGKEWFARYQKFGQAFLLGAEGGMVHFS